jgi:chemotaxis protein methyltransferase CheR
MRMRWRGFRKVRRQVCKRLGRRMQHLGIGSVEDYRDYLQEHADEWAQLDSLCRITISRFNRDRAVCSTLAQEVLLLLVDAARERGDHALRIYRKGGNAEDVANGLHAAAV